MKNYSPIKGSRPDKFSLHTESLNKKRLPEVRRIRALKWRVRKLLLVRLWTLSPNSPLYALIKYILRFLNRFIKSPSMLNMVLTEIENDGSTGSQLNFTDRGPPASFLKGIYKSFVVMVLSMFLLASCGGGGGGGGNNGGQPPENKYLTVQERVEIIENDASQRGCSFEENVVYSIVRDEAGNLVSVSGEDPDALETVYADVSTDCEGEVRAWDVYDSEVQNTGDYVDEYNQNPNGEVNEIIRTGVSDEQGFNNLVGNYGNMDSKYRIESNTPANTEVNENENIFIRVRVNGKEIGEVEWSVDGNPDMTGNPFDRPASDYGIGSHEVEAMVSNNRGETIKKFIVDVVERLVNTAPNVLYSSPSGSSFTLNKYNGEKKDVSMKCTDEETAPADIIYRVVVDGETVYEGNNPDGVSFTVNSIDYYTGQHSLRIECWDTGLNGGDEKQAYKRWTFNITNSSGQTNQPPTITTTTLPNATENQAYSEIVSCNDLDGDNVTLSASNLPSWASFQDNGDGTATISGTPSYDYVQHPDTQKTDNPTIVCNDGHGGQDQATLPLTTDDVNRPPYFTTQPPSQTVYYGGDTYYYDADAVDPDGDSLEYRALGLPYNLSYRSDTGEVGGDLLELGSFTIEIDVKDNFGGMDVQFHNIQVNP
jgi:hypothetical protein